MTKSENTALDECMAELGQLENVSVVRAMLDSLEIFLERDAKGRKPVDWTIGPFRQHLSMTKPTPKMTEQAQRFIKMMENYCERS